MERETGFEPERQFHKPQYVVCLPLKLPQYVVLAKNYPQLPPNNQRRTLHYYYTKALRISQGFFDFQWIFFAE